jgi:hypothetical protein
MRRSSEQPAEAQSPGQPEWLDLPDAPDFVAYPPSVSLDQALALNEQAKAWFPQSMPTPEERLASKCLVEFIL